MYSVQLSSVAQSCLTLCYPMDCSTPGFPVHHQLPELAQTHVHQVGDAIQPSHPLSSPSPPAFNLSQHQGLFQWLSSLHQVAKVLELQHHSFQWIFRTDFSYDWLVGSPCSPRDSQESSPIPQFESINSLMHSLLYGPIFTSLHDHWENHSFDSVKAPLSLLFNMLSRFVIVFFPRSLLISWLQSPSVVILEPKKVKLVTVSTFPPTTWHEVLKLDAWVGELVKLK